MRSVIRERGFEIEVHELIPDARQADAFVEGAEFVLARDPRAGCELDGVWFMPMVPVDGDHLTLYYTFDDSTVWLLSISAD